MNDSQKVAKFEHHPTINFQPKLYHTKPTQHSSKSTIFLSHNKLSNKKDIPKMKWSGKFRGGY
jgi:hypothetical protein